MRFAHTNKGEKYISQPFIHLFFPTTNQHKIVCTWQAVHAFYSDQFLCCHGWIIWVEIGQVGGIIVKLVIYFTNITKIQKQDRSPQSKNVHVSHIQNLIIILHSYTGRVSPKFYLALTIATLKCT